ncbi:hypothetical protein [Brevibacillus invocatus]|uniref:hypothetical protein n=1 Tax=Brevibacillus invocatus TaxID=173959 RepID=UPI00203D76C6|nr:hypothetical protein [Brevibacillus invocatus]MCM3079592.1 hypothetical protein [Brevibacillus invocatus]MCM3429790.1 hypothetical protein [Brevibacillus invocatus]
MREFVMGARLQMTDMFSRPMSAIREATDMFRGSVERANGATDHWVDANGRLRNSLGQYVARARETEQQIEANAHATSSWRDRLISLQGAIAAVAGAAVFKSAYNWLIDSNAQMEQYKNTLTVVMGSQEKATKTLEWATKFAAQTPFEIPQIVEATTRMQAYGIQADKTLGIVGDMASVMGKDLMQAVEAVADAQTGELERMKEFGITKQMILDQAKLLGSAPVNNSGQITDMKAFNAALFSLMEKRFKGGMEMQSKSFKGMLSNVSDFMGTMGRKLGQPLFDKAKEHLASFLDWLNRLQSDGSIDAFIAKIKTVSRVIWDSLSYAYKRLVSMAGKLQPVVQPILEWMANRGLPAVAVGIKEVYEWGNRFSEYVESNWSTIGPFIIGVVTALGTYAAYTKIVTAATKAWAAAQLALDAVMAMNPIGLIIVGIGLLIGAIIYLLGGFDNFKAKVAEVWAYTVQAWNNIWAVVQPILSQMWANMVATWNAILAAVMPVLNTIWTGILNVFNAIQSFWNTWGSTITAFWSILWAGIVGYAGAALQGLWTLIVNVFNVIMTVVQGVWGVIAGIIQTAWSIITGIFSVGLNLLSGNWSGAWQAMLDMLTGVEDGIVNFFGGLKNLFWDSGKAIIQTLVDGIKSMVDAPVAAIKSVLEKVREYLPFSDAKRGPLSELTYSGGAIMTTLATGVGNKAGTLHNAMADSFAAAPKLTGSASFQADVNAAGSVPAAIGVANINPAGTPAQGGSVQKTVTIQQLFDKLELHDVGNKDADSLVDEIMHKLYDRLQKADEVLGNAEMGALL